MLCRQHAILGRILASDLIISTVGEHIEAPAVSRQKRLGLDAPFNTERFFCLLQSAGKRILC